MLEIIKKYNFWQNEDIFCGYYRKSYFEKINQFLDNSLVKVLIGQRRAGKSYLMRMIIRYLIENRKVPRENILYLNMEMYELGFIKDDTSLGTIIKEFFEIKKPKGKVYFFFDEVQEIKNWEKIVNSYSQDHTTSCEIILSGSNAHLLSLELATYLTGRYVEIEIFPFSYTEYLDYYKKGRAKVSFIEYLRTGGIPECLKLDNHELCRHYLSSLIDSILLHDIVKRYQIRDVSLYRRLTQFIIDSTGNLFSVNKIVHFLVSSGYKTNVETISNYIQYLSHAFFIHDVTRFDIKGKKILSGERKYYLNDLSFKYYLTSTFDFSIGNYLENAVYLHYKRQGYTVYVGKINTKEIDFIVEKNGNISYIQVSYLLSNDQIIEREFGNLSGIKDHFPKLVVSMDDILFGNQNGINHLQVWDLLVD